ncbi:MAG: hypothetical protein H0T20_04685 [Actinobacteria bacterium]|nr:hypothetical protein [Actinomycetota bacterium]
MPDQRAELDRALALENATERKLAVVAVIDGQMQLIDFRAIVIGGLAVEFWTRGAYATTDIDLYLPHGPAVLQLLGPLGFERRGRHYVLPGSDVFVEAPGPSFAAEREEVYEVTLRSGFVVPLLSPADVLVDRLHQFVAGGHSDVAEQAVALLAAEELDHEHLRVRVREERLRTALEEMERIAGRVEAGETIESWDLHEIARALRAPGVD